MRASLPPDTLTALADAVAVLGGAGFPPALAGALQAVLPHDFLTIYAYPRASRPVVLFDTLPAPARAQVIEAYLAGPYTLDPFVAHLATGRGAGPVWLRDLVPEDFAASEYFRRHYAMTGIADEAGFVFSAGGIPTCLTVCRTGAGNSFSAHEVAVLGAALPLLRAAAERHWREAPDAAAGLPLPERAFERAFSALTPRERQVVKLVLQGHSAAGIARTLVISEETARMHRKNIYRKMNLCSQAELFARYVGALAGTGAAA